MLLFFFSLIQILKVAFIISSINATCVVCKRNVSPGSCVWTLGLQLVALLARFGTLSRWWFPGWRLWELLPCSTSSWLPAFFMWMKDVIKQLPTWLSLPHHNRCYPSRTVSQINFSPKLPSVMILYHSNKEVTKAKSIWFSQINLWFRNVFWSISTRTDFEGMLVVLCQVATSKSHTRWGSLN